LKIGFPLGKSSHIAVVEEFLSKEFCSELLSFCNDNFETLFEQGIMLRGLDTSYKNSLDWALKTSNEHEKVPHLWTQIVDFDTHIFENLTKSFNLYKDEFSGMNSLETVHDTSYRVQRYFKGQGFYKQHIDGAVWSGGESSIRILAAVVYLNDVEEGGETTFPDHGYKCVPRAGNMALFPASWTHPHIAEVPVSDDKWIISTFITV
jgi:hypothetical protein